MASGDRSAPLGHVMAPNSTAASQKKTSSRNASNIEPSIRPERSHWLKSSMRIDAPDDESTILQPTDNIPPRDVIRTFVATR